MKSRHLGTHLFHAALTFTVCAALAWPGACLAQTYISFDAPGAGSASGQGTFPNVITRNGFIGGTVIDSNSVAHGFVRLANGKFTTVQPPNSRYTFLAGMNWHGQVAGTFFDSKAFPHGYVKNADGTFVQLDVPASTGGTYVSAINSNGQIAGSFFTGSGQQGFFWDPKNPTEYATFTVVGSNATSPAGINDSGVITGNYGDFTGMHGYLRTPDGTITTFDFGGTSTVTQPVAINTRGEIVGNEGDEGIGSGFIRTPLGRLLLWGSEEHAAPETMGLSDTGVIVGFETSEGGNDLAFERDAAGNETLLAVPFSNAGTHATSVNRSGQVVGTYVDSNGATHGWLLTP